MMTERAMSIEGLANACEAFAASLNKAADEGRIDEALMRQLMRQRDAVATVINTVVAQTPTEEARLDIMKKLVREGIRQFDDVARQPHLRILR